MGAGDLSEELKKYCLQTELKEEGAMKKAMFVVKGAPGDQEPRVDVELEEALDIAGAGRYQLWHCLLMVLVLSSALLEIIGSAFVLPAAQCDLDIPDALKGALIGLPNIGIILTATVWGRLADSRGRRPVMLASTAAAGTLGALAAFMPNLPCYAVFKFAASLFLSCPSSLSFAYGGELVPRRRRDLAVLVLSAMLMMMSTLSPVIAWAILPFNYRVPLGSITFRPWRLLTIVYSLPLLLSSVLLVFAKESPKFLLTRGRADEALEVLRSIYETNTGYPRESFPVASLKVREDIPSEAGSELALAQPRQSSALDLLRPPHLKWMALTGFLMFGVFCLLNGLWIFSTDTINKVMADSGAQDGTICILMNQLQNQTSNATCTDDISTDTFSIMSITTFVYGLVVFGVILSPLSKKSLLVFTYVVCGVASLLSGALRQRMVAGVAMSALQVTALGVGPLTAYAVHLFPTSLRGTAVGTLLMFGRVGSVVGANVAGVSLAVACSATFYGFSALLFLCAALSLLLPKEASTTDDTDSRNS
ncbi:putative transporter svop-1 isoform X3 [Plutella xylostella]|nr:putative transporter svop-1 isoform X3 [Plutella xylostella]